MPIFEPGPFLGAQNTGYQISRSLRFRSSASAYLSRTPASAGNQQKWTWSGWVKRGSLTSASPQFLLGSGTNGTNDTAFYFTTADKIDFYTRTSSTIQGYITTNAVFRDASAWYHVVVVYDAANATSTSRMLIYVNNVLQAVTVNNTLPPSTNGFVNAAVAQYHGTAGLSNYLDGYLAEVNFIDGQALDPTSFGAYDTTTGVWGPKKYTGTYGTNGFYLNFSDNSGATSTTIGKDSSGNSNNWTPNNISVTSGTTYDSMIDSPTPYSDGTAYGRGNYATLNPLDVNSTYFVNATFSNANLSISATSSGQYYVHPTISNNTGKFYQEFTVTSLGAGGALTNSIVVSAPGNFGAVYCAYDKSGQKYISGAWTTGWTAWSTNDVIGIAVDYDAGSATYYLNGTLQGTLTFGSQGSAPLCVANNAQAGSGGTVSVSFNAGQRPFSISSIPSGFLALNTQNLPTPTIANGAQYFDAATYSGTSAARSVTINNGLFTPDLVWIKNRSAAFNHTLQDINRSFGSGRGLNSNTTAAEGADDNAYGYISAVGAGNVSVNKLGSLGANDWKITNYSGDSYALWAWKAGNGTSNIAVNAYGSTPSIASTVSANTSAGFSVVTYTGTGANATVGHGLGVAPSLIIAKSRSVADNWLIYHASLGNTQYVDFTTVAAATASTAWNNTSPTSTVFSLGTAPRINTASSTNVAYCFAPVAGYSAAFSFTGNGSSDGPMVFLNFRPRWLMIKRTDTTGNWVVFDTSRQTINYGTTSDPTLYPNLSIAEATGIIDILSNGFKVRYTDSDYNASNGTYIGYAIAENPFRISRAR